MLLVVVVFVGGFFNKGNTEGTNNFCLLFVYVCFVLDAYKGWFCGFDTT